MKKLLIVTVLLSLWLCGCSTTPKQATYKTLAAVGLAADTACNALVDAKVAGKVTDAQWEKAKKVQAEFFLAYNSACQAATFDYETAPSESLLKLNTILLSTINQILTTK